MMKFSSLHFHMVLVVALICVVVYVFYISKDILTLDTELRCVKNELDGVKRQLQTLPPPGSSSDANNQCVLPTRPQTPTNAPNAPVVAPITPVAPVGPPTAPDAPSAPVKAKKVAAKTVVIVEEHADDDDAESVDTQQVREMVNNMQHGDDDDIMATADDEGIQGIQGIREPSGAAPAPVSSHNETTIFADLASHSLVELKAMCRELDLPYKGSKAELVARLSNYQSS